MHSARSFFGLLTTVDTGSSIILAAGNGLISALRSSGVASALNHSSKLSLDSITGIRSWNGATSLFASVVTMVHDSIGSPVGGCQHSQRPAKAKTESSLR